MAEPDPKRWYILIAMGTILGVILLDETVVGVALPTVQSDLAMSTLAAHWVVNIYLLTLAALAGAAGRLGDIIGTRWLICAGLVIFGGASAAAGFATDGATLILARMVQGVGAAIILPLSLVLVSMSFAERDRGMALGIYGAIGTSFLALGPVLGGVLTEYASWRWIFWINPPIVLLVVAVTWVTWRDPPRKAEPSFDWAGLFLLVGGLGLAVFGIMEGPERGWGQLDVVVPLALGAVLLAALIPAELRARTPLIAVRLFANPTFAAANLIVLLAQYVKIATFVFASMYFQNVAGLSPLMSGVALLPSVVPPALMATVAGRAADTYGTRLPSLLGVLGTTVGLAAIALGTGAESTWFVYAGLLLFGIAVTFLFVPSQRAVMMSVPPQMQGQAGGIALSSQLLGGTMGMAICGTLLVATGSYPVVFWATAAVAALVLVYGYFAIDRADPAAA